jgi:uncharacterized membrane protein YwzB
MFQVTSIYYCTEAMEKSLMSTIVFPPPAVCNADTFYFKMSSTVTFKIHKISLKSHFLFICCDMFWAYRAIIRQPLIDRNHCTAWAHISVYLHAIIACRHIQECTPALSSCYFHVLAFMPCSFVHSFSRWGVCPLYFSLQC